VIVTTLHARLQKNLQDFIKKHNEPIASVVVVEVKTGRILALAQGRNPKKWGSTVHTGLYPGFPAASIFKVVPTAAALEVVQIDPTINMSSPDRCGTVNPRGLWMYNFAPKKIHGMNLETAFANSCNSFFAKLAVQYVGMGLIGEFAEKFGWGHLIPADFYIPLSPIDLPVAGASNIQTVGRFAAGFGRVGLSPVHAAWFNLLIANKGKAQALRINKDENSTFTEEVKSQAIIDEATSWKIRQIMHKTVVSGTARGVFHRKRYRKLLSQVGGKTGTLTSHELKAQITWFAGLMPYENPEIIVSSVVVVDSDRWHIRGVDLAAEAFYQWFTLKAEKEKAVLQSLSSEKRKKGL
jgi:cell division protein FtsI/penicillin-binding protein 2